MPEERPRSLAQRGPMWTVAAQPPPLGLTPPSDPAVPAAAPARARRRGRARRRPEAACRWWSAGGSLGVTGWLIDSICGVFSQVIVGVLARVTVQQVWRTWPCGCHFWIALSCRFPRWGCGFGRGRAAVGRLPDRSANWSAKAGRLPDAEVAGFVSASFAAISRTVAIGDEEMTDVYATQPWTPQAEVEPKKRPRIFRWFFLAVQIGFLVWIIAGVNDASDNCVGEVGASLEACQAGTTVGAGIGVALVIGLWLAVDFILAITWLIFRRK